MRTTSTSRINWSSVLDRAAEIVDAHDGMMSLRQVFYRLVAVGTIPNNHSAYKGLSRTSAVARREGRFPALDDRTRTIHLAPSWSSPQAARDALREQYRIDRTAGQQYQLVLGVEKDTLRTQITGWFGDLGVPVIVPRGYGSQTYADDVTDLFIGDDRPTVLIYAGDFDPSGEDILRDLLDRTDGIDELRKVAITEDTIDVYDLPENPGKLTDSRAAKFYERYGRLVQVEVEALEPGDLRSLFSEAIGDYWDGAAYAAALVREEIDRESL